MINPSLFKLFYGVNKGKSLSEVPAWYLIKLHDKKLAKGDLKRFIDYHIDYIRICEKNNLKPF